MEPSENWVRATALEITRRMLDNSMPFDVQYGSTKCIFRVTVHGKKVMMVGLDTDHITLFDNTRIEYNDPDFIEKVVRGWHTIETAIRKFGAMIDPNRYEKISNEMKMKSYMPKYKNSLTPFGVYKSLSE